ncbi:MAG: TspO/MBR family protein [Christensenellales bacterium]
MKVTRKGFSDEADALVPAAPETPAQSRKIELPAWAWLVICVAFPLFLGAVIAFLTGSASVELLGRIKLPPLFPQDTVLKAAWLAHYILMGIGNYFVLKSGCAPIRKRRAMIAYGIQLAIGAAWAPVFFLAEAFIFAVGLSLLFMASIAITVDFFTRCSAVSGKLLVPCLLWSSFLSYFTIGTALLN